MIQVEKIVITVVADEVKRNEPGVWILPDEPMNDGLVLTEQEWQEFRSRMKNGDFDDV